MDAPNRSRGRGSRRSVVGVGFVEKLAHRPESEQFFRRAKTAKQAILVVSSMERDAARRKKGRSKPDRVFRHSLSLLLLLWMLDTSQASVLIRPMLVSYEATPGTVSQITILLENRSPTATQRVATRIVELLQNESGKYYPQDPCSPDPNVTVDLSHRATCREWLSFSDRPDRIEVEAGATVTLSLSIDTPAQAQGFYCAAAIIAIMPKTQASLITARIDYVIPILIEIKDRPGRRQIDLVDVGLTRLGTESDTRTTVQMVVHNNGRTYNRLKASVRIRPFSEDHRHTPGEEIEIKELSIIPGSRLRLETKLPHHLTPGRYLVTGRLSVDGGPAFTLEKEVRLTE